MDERTARTIREEVAAAERRLLQRLANLVQLTTLSNPTASGNEDGADGWPDAGKAYQRSPKRWQHFGFRSVPPKNTAALMLLVGGGGTAEALVAEDAANYGPDPGAEGVALFSSKAGAYLTIDKNGEMVLAVPVGQLIKSGGATDFAIKGTTYRNAQAALNTAWATFNTALSTFAGFCTGPTAGQLATFQMAVTTLNTAITTAFEGAASSYLSTVNKLG